jgi:hypothetical protein
MNLTHRGNFIINDQLEVAPKSLLVHYDSLASSNSGRTLDGVMHIYWVFNKIRKLEIELRPSSPEEVAQIFSRVMGQFYNITYWDVLENQEKTIYVYTSNADADWYSGIVRNGLLQGIKFHAIELAGENDAGRQVIVPVINDTTGILTIYNDSPTTNFMRLGDDLLVDEENPALSYAIVGKDLIQYEE